jgi:hypothetical protein
MLKDLQSKFVSSEEKASSLSEMLEEKRRKLDQSSTEDRILQKKIWKLEEECRSDEEKIQRNEFIIRLMDPEGEKRVRRLCLIVCLVLTLLRNRSLDKWKNWWIALWRRIMQFLLLLERNQKINAISRDNSSLKENLSVNRSLWNWLKKFEKDGTVEEIEISAGS